MIFFELSMAADSGFITDDIGIQGAFRECKQKNAYTRNGEMELQRNAAYNKWQTRQVS